jgi:DNA-binding NarL/FixJ family response regulator
MASMTQPRQTQLYIVDDSAAIRHRLVDMFSRMDSVRVVGEAADAPKAVVDILALRPETVLLDLDLGTSSGMQVLRAVVPQMPEVTFVVLTNHSEPQYRRACQRAGAAYFLDKSTEFDQVRQVVAEIASARH